ncbi:MAG: hypothetical protein AAGJ31_10975, partial [Verrucomicrobiota bacterium]
MKSFSQYVAVGLWVIAALLVPWILMSFAQVKLSSGDVTSWMPEGTEERVLFDRFSETFQTHDFLLVGLEGSEARDPRLPRLARLIKRLDVEQAREAGHPRLVSKTLSYPELVA